MTSMARRACALFAAAVCAAACTPTLDWREVRPEGSGLLLLMPCRPDTQKRSVALAGPPLQLTVSACSAGGLSWGLAHADVIDPARVGPALLALRAALAANLGASAAASAPLAVPGATPNVQAGRWQLAGHLPDGKPVRLQQAVFARGTQVFQASLLGEAPGEEAVAGFFESIRFER